MSKGRLSLIEQKRRLNLLLEFVFIFRYVTRKQMLKFVDKVIKLSYPRWLVDYSSKKAYLNSYYDPGLKTKIYYLSSKGKKLIWEREALIDTYSFDKRSVTSPALGRHYSIVNSFFALYELLDIRDLRNWIPQWVIRLRENKREKLPDALLVTSSGAKIALVVETDYRRVSSWKELFAKYIYDVDKLLKYHAVLIVIPHKHYFDRIIQKTFELYPRSGNRAFIFTSPALLQEGQGFYKDKVIDLREAVRLVKIQIE